MDKEQARFVLRCARPGKIETERNEFAAALAHAASDQELREWLADEHTRDNTFAAALRAVPVPASLRRELCIGMEWTARSGKPLNRFSSAWATIRRHFGSKYGGHTPPRPQPHVSSPTEHRAMNTKRALTLGKFILILSSALLATSAEVSAKHPRPRVAIGSIEVIDWTTRTLRIKTDTDPGSLTLVWNDRTLFTAGNGKASAAELARRKPVTVWYYTPWIGQRFASRIILRKDGSLPLRR